MAMSRFSRVPRHVGFIPDGNRRWAQSKGLGKEDGYRAGISPGLELYRLCIEYGIKEVSVYGFTQDNTKRPSAQTAAYRKACVEMVEELKECDVDLLVIGDSSSPLFPQELLNLTTRTKFGKGTIRVNFLANYSWKWDLECALARSEALACDGGRASITDLVASNDVSRLDLIVRWGGRRRLSGFLPIQSVYADIYVIDEYWPAFKPEHFIEALEWYQKQDVTLGG